MGAKYTRKDEAGRVYAKTRRGFDVLIESSAKTMSEEQQRGHGVIFDDDEDDPFAEAEEREDPEPESEDDGDDEPEPDDEPEDGDGDDEDEPDDEPEDGDGDDEDEPDEDVEYPVHKGGPNWELSDGSNVQGSRDVAEQAEAELHSDDGDDDEEA